MMESDFQLVETYFRQFIRESELNDMPKRADHAVLVSWGGYL